MSTLGSEHEMETVNPLIPHLISGFVRLELCRSVTLDCKRVPRVTSQVIFALGTDFKPNPCVNCGI